ncbi:MAG TPA: hypothetical protein DCY88_28790 [Cyanobacteria bacterium UBA11372]|nr:hypothetical protein [Cyanobacteria bacterium UBA11372]
MCQDQTSQDPCSCCPEIIAIAVVDIKPDPVTLSAAVDQPVKDLLRQHLVQRVAVPARAKTLPVRLGVWF